MSRVLAAILSLGMATAPAISEAIITPGVLHEHNHTVRVRKGDTLWDLAKQQYRDPNQYWRIASCNGINNPDQIREGQVLRLPGKTYLSEIISVSGDPYVCH